MSDKLMDRIQELQSYINKEKADETSYYLISLGLFDENPDNRTSKEKTDYNLAILVWLCLKINLECQVLHNGNGCVEESLRHDIDQVFDCVKDYEFEWETPAHAIMDALDLLKSFDAINEYDLQKYSSSYYNRVERNLRSISDEMYALFISVSQRLLFIGEDDTGYHLIEELCTLSRARNPLDLHKRLLVHAIKSISNSGNSAICNIGDTNKELFKKECSDYSGDFYWFYACSLHEAHRYDDALFYYEQCWDIRKKLYGEDHWLTALAKRNRAILGYNMLKKASYLDELLEFALNVEYRKYQEIDLYVAKDMRRILQGETIALFLVSTIDGSEIPEYDKLIGIYESICNEFPDLDNPLISKRLAWNFRGKYYYQHGELLLAENAFRSALSEPCSDAEKDILSDAQVQSNIMTLANLQNDHSSFFDAFVSVTEQSDGLSTADIIRTDIDYLAFLIQSGQKLEQNELKEMLVFLHTLCEAVIEQDADLEELHSVAAMYIVAAAGYLITNGDADTAEQLLYLKALNYVEKDSVTYNLQKVQRNLVLLVESLLAFNLGLPETEKYIQHAVEYADTGNLPFFVRTGILHIAVSFYGKHNKKGLALSYAEKQLSYLTETWHGFVKYANDARLINALEQSQFQFLACYAVIRQLDTTENAYEKILRFKDLSSLAGRERNRITKAYPADSGLVKKINSIQDKLAEMEKEKLFQDRSLECQELKSILRTYESEFAMRFPENAAFKSICLKDVADAIPDNSIVLEYFLSGNEFGLTQSESQQISEDISLYDLYLIGKEHGRRIFKRYVIRNAEMVQWKAEKFIEIYQEKSANNGVSEHDDSLEDLRFDLFEFLIEPVLEDIRNVDTLYFAPDISLVNLPFELLYKEEKLGDTHQIVKIECARDFLFTSSQQSLAEGSLVIGNPAYFVREKEIIPFDEKNVDQRPDENKSDDSIEIISQIRMVDMDLMQLGQLPFAEVESKIVARYCSVLPWIGTAAAKDRLLQAYNCRNIHIATHGFFDLNGDSNAIYSSCLMFAGVKNWMQSGLDHNRSKLPSTVMRMFGDGIVSADEVSRLDLHTTNLVVLSSCLNGRNDLILSKGFHGMVGAFAAAGVKYVIANLWNAPESLSTVILMDAFYRNYIDENMEPPFALSKAKAFLKTVTIDKMREAGWFDFIRQSDLDPVAKQKVALLETYSGRFQPYKNEIYWGGLSCYRCN